MANMCLRISNQDRVGLVLDISKVLEKENINILSMEVVPNIMYLEINLLLPEQYTFLHKQLCAIPQINTVNLISSMPHQDREQQLKAVMDTIGEGIIAIDKEEVITHFNPAAEKILNCQSVEVLGKKIKDSTISEIPLLKALRESTPFSNYEIVLTKTKGKSHCVTSGCPIKDAKESVIGAVAVLKTMQDVKELVYSVTKPYINRFSDILHVSEKMEYAINLAKLVAKNDSTVLIRGESGTGKELFARSIHMESPRRDAIFAPINCAALPDTLLESELFGYEEGSFSGAKKGGKSGLFEYANGGTVFLDEIGELSASIQAKLLRVLQEGKIRRIGSNQEIAVDIRLIAATHRNLEEMIQKKEFRDDLYYRLNVIPIYIPPLRERKEDLPLLIDSLLLKTSHRLKKQITHLSRPAMNKLIQHNWFGNVRELENVIERAVSLAPQGEINPEHIMLDQMLPSTTMIAAPAKPQKLKEVLAETECNLLREAIKTYGSSRQIGQALGLSHTGVLNRMRKYKLFEKQHQL